MSVVIAIIIFGTMVFFHEMGHFLVAKWAGVRVFEFSIGMGPKLFGFTKGETKYSLRLFPIGGYVDMQDYAWEEPVDLDEEEEEEEEKENNKEKGDIHKLLDYLEHCHDNDEEEQQDNTLTIELLPEDEDTEAEQIDHSFYGAPVIKRILITSAGAVVNIILGFIAVLVLTSMQSLLGTPVIADFHPEAVSSQYLQKEDRILKVNGSPVNIDNDISYKLILDSDAVVSMDVLRNGERIHFDEVRFNSWNNGNDTKSIVMDFIVYGENPTLPKVVGYAFNWTGSIIRLVWDSLISVVKGDFALNQLSGPVGVTAVISQATDVGVEPLIFVFALITVNLGVFNLLPLPALDGGRIFFMLIELITKKHLDRNVENIIHTVGMVLLMILLVIITFNDIVNLFSGGI